MKRWMKIAAMLVAVLWMGMLTACSASEKETVSAGSALKGSGSGQQVQKETRNLKVGICVYKFQDDFMTLYREELKDCLVNEYGILPEHITVTDGRGNQEEQLKQIDRLITDGADVLLVNLVETGDAKGIADQCKEAGIPVVFINRKPEEEEILRWEEEGLAASYVGADGRQSGIYQGEIILETPGQGDFNGDGTISYAMITGGTGSPDASDRTEYSIKALEDGGMKTEKLFEQSAGWEQDKGKEAAATALTKYGRKIEVIFCNNDAMALGAREAVLEAGRIVGRDICLVGVDALDEAIGYIKDGTMTGTVLNDYISQSHKAAEAAVNMALGEEAESCYMIDYLKIAVDPVMAEAIAKAGKPKSFFDITKGAREFRAGIAVHEFGDNFMTLYRTELETYLTDTYEAVVTMVDGEGEQEIQNRQIQELIAREVDVLIVNPVKASSSGEIVDMCREAGVPVVFINSEPGEEEFARWEEENIWASYIGIGPGAVGTGWNDYDSQAHLAADVAAQMVAGRSVLPEYRVEFVK